MSSSDSIRPRRRRVNYHEYLASREWALKKRQVRERSGGLCERCGAAQEATHHLTYERLGDERLDDLLAVCRPCHEFLSGVIDTDPAVRPTALPIGIYIEMFGEPAAGADEWMQLWNRIAKRLTESLDPNGWPVYLLCFGLRLQVHFTVQLSGRLGVELQEIAGEEHVWVQYPNGDCG